MFSCEDKTIPLSNDSVSRQINNEMDESIHEQLISLLCSKFSIVLVFVKIHITQLHKRNIFPNTLPCHAIGQCFYKCLLRLQEARN